MIKILFFDIDGTLRPFETGHIPESTKLAIQKAREAGIKTCIATGRHWLEVEVEDLLEGLPFDAFVTLDGNYCYTLPEGASELPITRDPVPAEDAADIVLRRRYDVRDRLTNCYYDPRRGDILQRNPIPEATIARLLDYLDAHPYPVIFEEERNIYVNFVNDDIRHAFAEVHSIIPPVRDPREALGQPIFMLIPVMPYEASLELTSVLPECQVVRWSDGMSFDLTPLGVNKVHGIDRVIREYGFDLSETAAIGDGMNDLSMLSHVGLGIAMGNAHEECKAAAAYVTDHIMEDGLAKAVDYVLACNQRERQA